MRHFSAFSLLLTTLLATTSTSTTNAFAVPKRPSRFLVSALARLDSVLDFLQKGRSYNDRSNHPLFQMSPNWFPLSRSEIRNDHALPLKLVEGSLPPDIDGFALRIGPNADPDVGFNKRLNAIIDGDGMLHSIRLDGPNNRALYSSGWIETPRRRLEAEYLQGKAFFLKIGEMTGLVGLIKLLLTPLKVKAFGQKDICLGQANTALVYFDGKLYALQENALPFEIRLHENGTFESVGYETFGGVLDYPMSAHPKVDPTTGELFFHGYSPFQKPHLRWGVVSPSSSNKTATVTRYVNVESPSGGAPFSHDFCITENYILLLDNSVRFDFGNILKGEVLQLDEASPLRFGICPKNASLPEEIMWYSHDEAAALLHFVGAWEEDGDTIVVWAPLWNKFVGDVTAMTETPEQVIRMKRFTLDLKDPRRRMVIRNVENDDDSSPTTPVDFPSINFNFVGKPIDCAFAGIQLRNVAEFDGIAKWQTTESSAAGTTTANVVQNVLYGNGITGGEPIVAPKVGRGKENSSAVYVMSLIHDDDSNNSYLVIYDGEDFDDGKPIAKYLMPHRVPNGLHAKWVDAGMWRDRTTMP